jgi:hypothetical protein
MRPARFDRSVVAEMLADWGTISPTTGSRIELTAPRPPDFGEIGSRDVERGEARPP